MVLTLDRAVLHKTYQIRDVQATEDMKQHLYTLGFAEGVKVRCVLRAPGGDPLAFWVRGAVIALRKSQLKTISAIVGA